MKATLARIVCGLGAGIVVLASVGCGGPENIGRVSGTVTLDGQPLEGAYVEFQPVGGNAPSGGLTDASGHYTLKYTRAIDGAEIGEHNVRITTASGGDPDAEPPKPAIAEKLPPKYHRNTELKATVESGSNTRDFDLESK